MAGIAGVIGDNIPDVGVQYIEPLLRIMKHKDFYSVETYIDKEFPVAFGIVGADYNLPLPKNQIISNKKIIALMDGEIFGYKDIKRELITKGHIFKSETDTEFLVHLYEEEGSNFLSRIKGQFVMVLYDKRNNQVFLINDRYGFKPLYYTQLSHKFIFASEVKAILEYPGIAREVNPSAVAELALFNYPLGEKSLIKNIYRLPPASIWCFNVRTGRPPASTKKNYWKFDALLGEYTDFISRGSRVLKGEGVSSLPLKTDLPLLSYEESLKKSGMIFQKVVNDLTSQGANGDNLLGGIGRGFARRAKGLPVGLTLTGGYDTRTILSALDCNNVEVHSLTFGSKDSNECLLASKVASMAGCEHLIQEFEDDFITKINDFLCRTVWLTDGLCNIVHSPLLYVFEKQRNFINPCLMGFGGSEIIRGLQDTGLSFHPNSKKILESPNPNKAFLNIIKHDDSFGFFSPSFLRPHLNSSTLQLFNSSTLNERALFFTLFEIFRKYYGANVMLLASCGIHVRLPYMDNDFISFIVRTPSSILHTTQFSRNPFERLKGQQFSANIIKYNNPRLLTIPTDRGYSPFWNLNLFGYPIIFFHQIRRRLVGASHELPLQRFLRLEAKKIIEEIVGTSRGHEYYNIPKIKKALLAYPNWSLQVWQELSKIVTFELWLRQLIN